MALTKEQQQYANRVDETNEASRWGHLYYPGSEEWEKAKIKLEDLKYLSAPQIKRVLEALQTGKFETKVMTALESVREMDLNEKNTQG